MSNPINNQTKPSRINRKRKKLWKIAPISDLINLGLTDCYRVAILSTSINRSTGIGVSEIHGASRQQCGFFMREISALHIMSGWVGTRKSGRVVCPVRQPIQSGTMIGVMLSGLKPYTRSQS